MGYEVKLYAGRVTTQGRDGLGHWLQIWSMFDLCTPGYDSETYKLSADHSIGVPIYFYGTDGNTEITSDCYDKRLKAIPLDDALKALETDSGSDSYRRFKIAVDVLRSLKEHSGESLSVVLYGH